MGAYGAGAALGGAVWASSLPPDARAKPWTWPGRVADGVARSLVSLSPRCADDPVNVKYSLLAASFGLFTAVGFGPFPMAVMPSWTGRRCSRAFPAWTLLAAVSSYNLKEARESGRRLADRSYRTLSNGLAAFGGAAPRALLRAPRDARARARARARVWGWKSGEARRLLLLILRARAGTYLAARVGAVFVDPSFPVHYKVVTQVIGYQALAAAAIGLTLRPDGDLVEAG